MVRAEIETLIPHRDGMRLIGEIVELNRNSAVTSATVTEDWPLVRDNHADPIVLVELVAQTSGLFISWAEKSDTEENLEGKGWLVGIRKAAFTTDRIPVNSRITIRSKRGYAYEEYTEVVGTAEIEGKSAGEMTLQVFWARGDRKHVGMGNRPETT